MAKPYLLKLLLNTWNQNNIYLFHKINLIKHIYATDSMLLPMEAYWLQQESGLTMYDLSKFLLENKLEVQNG